MSMAVVVTLSQTERNLPTTANFDTRNFSDLACWLIVQIGPISLNATTPSRELRFGSRSGLAVGPSSRPLSAKTGRDHRGAGVYADRSLFAHDRANSTSIRAFNQRGLKT